MKPTVSSHLHYFVDGYNLLFRALDFSGDLQHHRELLIHELAEHLDVLDIDITIIFDSSYPAEGCTRGHMRNLEVVFSAAGESADTYIINALTALKSVVDQIVVTSDKGLASQARSIGAKTMGVEAFYRWLQSRSKKQRRKDKVPPSTFRSLTAPKPPVKSLLLPVVITVEDRYQKIFEQRLEKIEKETVVTKPAPSKTKPVKRPRKPPRIMKESPESDSDRWQRIFEERNNEK